MPRDERDELNELSRQAKLDQLLEGQKDLAALIWGTYQAFLRVGFDEGQALYLASTYMDIVVGWTMEAKDR